MLDDSDDLAILEGILGLASAFQRTVIAEGVETEEHGKLLLQLGCDLGQGFGIAKPMPSTDILHWVKTWKPTSGWKNINKMSSEDFSLLFATIDHRCWVRGIQQYIDDLNDNPPPLKATSCRFDQWLKGTGKRNYSSLSSFNNVMDLHEKIHNKGSELFNAKENGTDTQLDLKALYEIHDSIEKELKELINEVPQI
ncbi:MAG: EAL domain-containing protein [Gammaproteobacteria bacterium]|jgi:hypothetical protein|nr:EAL domain-containing protein [Gammaproteobacteria bacterium]MBT3724521.1 EAL domain-containing protein [Gammaproteobacteria bacterium]MBT4078054.1 EAL domain-containing protein [Gammaproteobacteria bacterium]MBT4194472.1 EAL domain-containing protein [Gammaproteobacteria bacterium]MBT4451154.1 EAL domain-containing protein [Gammaproteobacteria bacterium]